MTDWRERAVEDESPLQRLLDAIPGFKGYRERQVRRRADQLLRDHLVSLLDRAKAALQRLAAKLSRAGKLALVGLLDRAIGLLRKVRDKIRYADYGYTGWFDTPQIREEELDRMYEFDLQLRDMVMQVLEMARQVAEAQEEEMEAAIERLEAALRELEEQFDKREEYIARLLAE